MPTIKGRHTRGTGKPDYDAEIKPREDGFSIRVDDQNNIDFWLDIHFTEAEYRKLLADKLANADEELDRKADNANSRLAGAAFDPHGDCFFDDSGPASSDY